MTKIKLRSEIIEVEPSMHRPERGMLKTLCFMEARYDNPGISNNNASRLAGLAADLILRDYDMQISDDNNLIAGE